MKKVFYSVIALAPFMPALAFAQYQVQGGFINSVLGLIHTVVTIAFPLLTAISVIVFIVQLIKYIMAEPADKKNQAKGVLYSIVALFIILSIFGIIAILQNITGTGGNNSVNPNQVPTVPLNF